MCIYIYRYMFIDPPRDPSLQALSVWPDLAMAAHAWRLAAALWKFNPLDRRGGTRWDHSGSGESFFSTLRWWNGGFQSMLGYPWHDPSHGWSWISIETTMAGWWFGTWMLWLSIQLGIIIPTDELIFFRGVAQPPTSIQYVISADISCTLIIMPFKFDNNIYISHYNPTNAYYIILYIHNMDHSMNTLNRTYNYSMGITTSWYAHRTIGYVRILTVGIWAWQQHSAVSLQVCYIVTWKPWSIKSDGVLPWFLFNFHANCP